jgi:hypothetical protein
MEEILEMEYSLLGEMEERERPETKSVVKPVQLEHSTVAEEEVEELTKGKLAFVQVVTVEVEEEVPLKD